MHPYIVPMTYLELSLELFFRLNRFQHREHETIPRKSGRGGSVGVVRLARLAPLDDVVGLFHSVVGPLDMGKVVHPLDALPILLVVLVLIVTVRLRNRERLVA